MKAATTTTIEATETSVFGSIYSSVDYDAFKDLDGNRPKDEKHIRELVRSIQQNKVIAPIQVNENLEIIDGQHRVEAHRRTKTPVYFYIVKGANLETVHTMNSHTQNWVTEDYMDSYIARGLKDYRIYKEFLNTYKFTHKINILLLKGTNGYTQEHMKEFIRGEFKIENLEKAVEVANKLMEFEPLYKGFRKRNWVLAIVRALNVNGFAWHQFVTKAKFQTTKLIDCTTTDHYLQVIEDVYNYKNRIRIHIRKP